MKKNVLPFFSCIPNHNLPKKIYQDSFTKDQRGKLVMMQSIKDETIMEYFFVLENLRPLYKKHISDYLTHVLGHEGKNSLLSILKEK